ncbi:MAG: hypothetical protein IT308_01715 [Anaerolineaceae bacterium]|nr:hypothetical protein [Anaerolineaceae bacterium]
MRKNTPPFSWVYQTRRNHALEHATLQLIAKKTPGCRLAGYSGPYGFFVVGNISTPTLQEALEEALARLKAGEAQLAIHPNCGTNFVTAGLLAGVAAWLAMLGVGKSWRQKLERIPLVVVFSTLALMFSPPLGMRIQKDITTLAQLDNLQVVGIDRLHEGSPVVHRVRTCQGA